LYLPLDPDRNGSTSVTHIIEEGYKGYGALKGIVDGGHKEIGIEVTVREYNEWVRYGKKHDQYVP
jgi:hypothetical protein